MTVVMIIFGVLTLLSACGVVFSRRSLHSALWLVATLFLVAVHFALLGADFVAALQIMIYAGAIMVLVVFTIMLLGLEKVVDAKSFPIPRYIAGFICAAFAAMLTYVMSKELVFSIADSSGAVPASGDPKEVGRLLLTEHVYAFEVTALLLLAAIIGAVVLAYDKKRPLASERGLRAMHAKGEANA